MRTTRSTMRRVRYGVAVAGFALWSATWVDAARPAAARPQGTGVQRGDGAKRESVSADISITRSRVTGTGAPEGVSTQVTYHWLRERLNTRWRTIVTLPTTMPWAVDPQTGNARDVGDRAVRVEDDEDGTLLRFYNRRGEQLDIPAAADLGRGRTGFSRLPDAKGRLQSVAAPEPVGPQMLRPAVTPAGQSWADTLVAQPGGTSARRTALQRLNGVSKGRVRGLDRYLSYRGEAAIETLVDPATAVPVEVNIVRGGALVSQTVITYAPSATGALIRQRLYSTRVADAEGRRATVDMRFSNVVTTGGAQ